MVVSRWFQGGFKGAAAEGFGEGGRRRGPGGAGPPQRGLGGGRAAAEGPGRRTFQAHSHFWSRLPPEA